MDDLMDRLRGVTGGKLDYTNTPNSLRLAAADHIEQLVATREELEAKLAKVVETLEYYNVSGYEGKEARATLAELSSVSCANLKGQNDE